MATALKFIKSAFSLSGQNADETEIEASEANDALDLLNDMMAEWELSGANLGFAPVKDLADEVRIPRGAYQAVKMNLMVLIGIAFEIPISQEKAIAASSAKRKVMAIYKKPLTTVYPSTLPMGSGNECGSDYLDDRFYPKVEPENF